MENTSNRIIAYIHEKYIINEILASISETTKSLTLLQQKGLPLWGQ